MAASLPLTVGWFGWRDDITCRSKVVDVVLDEKSCLNVSLAEHHAVAEKESVRLVPLTLQQTEEFLDRLGISVYSLSVYHRSLSFYYSPTNHKSHSCSVI